MSLAMTCNAGNLSLLVTDVRERPLRLPGGGGGGGSVWPEYFFGHFQGQNILFQSSSFFSIHSGPEFFLYNTNLEASFHIRFCLCVNIGDVDIHMHTQ